MTREEVMSALTQAVPGLRDILRQWQYEGRCPGDGLGDDLGVAARHLAESGGTANPELSAALGVVERCLTEGPHDVRMAAALGFLFNLWLALEHRPSVVKETGQKLPPCCRAIWEVCPGVAGGFRAAFERIGWPGREPEAEPDAAPDSAGM